MSPLTKLFVGLLVVLSLLLTAATVTFVNTLDNQRKKRQDDVWSEIQSRAAKINETLRK